MRPCLRKLCVVRPARLGPSRGSWVCVDEDGPRWAPLLSHAAGRRQTSLGTPVPRTPTAGAPTIAVQASQGIQTGAGSPLEEEPRIDANQLLSMTRGGAVGRQAALQARLRRKGGKGMGSRHLAGRLASPADPAPGVACRLGTLKASDEGKARRRCFSGDSAGLAGGILKSHSQEGKQRLGNYKDKVLTRLWRRTSYVSTARWCHHCSSKTPSSYRAQRSSRGAGQGVGRGGQRGARLERHLGGRPQERKIGRAIRLRLMLACLGLRSFGVRSRRLHLPLNDHLRASRTGS